MHLRGIPVLALLIAMVGAAMLIPAIMAFVEGDERIARAFFFSGVGALMGAGVLALALQRPPREASAREEISVYLLAWLVLPAVAAVPLMLTSRQIGIGGAFFEMVAALTTTGGTVYFDLDLAPRAVNLWRGMTGWIGGLLILMAAHAVLAPRNLGGVEVRGSGISLSEAQAARTGDLDAPTLGQRVRRSWRVIAPAYAGLTGAAMLLLSFSGQTGLESAVHGMSILSTSGISPHQAGFAAAGGTGAEVVAAVFMVIAATRLSFEPGRRWPGLAGWQTDPEVRLMVALVGAATLALFARHWFGVLTIDEKIPVEQAGDALWGAFFTSISFITTTGFDSSTWESARNWSGLENPGLVLLALCAIGGGAATTAGGVKLIRVHVLALQGSREIGRLTQPSAVPQMRDPTGTGRSRAERRDGALIAWAFTMLFLAAAMFGTLALTLAGLGFEEALVAALSGLSNTGPAYALVSGHQQGFASLGSGAQAVMVVLMIIGRVETLALIALINPDRWR